MYVAFRFVAPTMALGEDGIVSHETRMLDSIQFRYRCIDNG